MQIPLTKPLFGTEELGLVGETLASGWVSQGPHVAEFEKLVAAYTGAPHAIALTSCTTALFAALKLVGIEEGDEVIVPSLSFIASANAIVHAGARPVFCEVDARTLNMTVEHVESLVTRRTKAIMPVHQLGMPCDLDPLCEFARTRRLVIIEDAACALGSSYRGRRIGATGTVCFSFHPRKLITTGGEGGMITTGDAEFAARARAFRSHGMTVDDLARHTSTRLITEEYPSIGYNFRMTDVQAAIGIAQMRRLPKILEGRKRIAQLYNEQLSTIPWLRTPFVPSYADFNYQSYVVTLADDAPLSQAEFMQQLLTKGIATRRGVMAAHLEKCYRDLVGAVELPQTEHLTSHTVVLPIYPQMTESEIGYVVDALQALA